jgi:hypothetical protein
LNVLLQVSAAHHGEIASGVIQQSGMVEPGLACIVAQKPSSSGGVDGHFFSSHMLSKRVSLLSASTCRLLHPTLKSKTMNH